MTGRSAVACALFSLMLLSACATTPQDPTDLDAEVETNDPLEKYNRAIGKFNDGLDQFILRPTAIAYRAMLPSQVRDAFRNFFDNLRAPVILVNDVLQGEAKRAGITLARFLTNSTIGLAGFIDTADRAFGLKFHNEDFGQTLAVWGVGEGSYLMLPLIGPSNPRDAVGLVVDRLLDPWTYLATAADAQYASAGRMIVDGVDKRARAVDALDEVKRTSVDYYATLRSLYRQRRAGEIRNGADTAVKPIPINQGPGAAPVAGIEPTPTPAPTPAPTTPTTAWAGSTASQGRPAPGQPAVPSLGVPAAQPAIRAYVETVDDILGYRFTVVAGDRVAMQLTARSCDQLNALVGELLPRQWIPLLKGSIAADGPGTCRIDRVPGLV